MRNDSSQTYNTKQSKVRNFGDFERNKKEELDDMKKVQRSFTKNDDDVYNLPNTTKFKFNKVTHKMDDLSKAEVEDFIEDMEEESETPKHKYKIVKEYEDFNSSDMSNEMPSEMGKVEYHSDSEETSYMFFGNIETIHRQSCEMYEMDEQAVNAILNDGHNWAEDHISVTKELISQVHNFLMNKDWWENEIKEDLEHNENYMFFGNLESICRMCEELLELDEQKVDDILADGHDWAEDHIASAKEDCQQVYEFLKSELE